MTRLIKSFLVLAALIFTAGAASATTAYTTADLNLRYGPGTSYPVVSLMPVGSPVEILECDDYGWCRVDWEGWEGYAAVDYLDTANYAPAYYPPAPVYSYTAPRYDYHYRRPVIHKHVVVKQPKVIEKRVVVRQPVVKKKVVVKKPKVVKKHVVKPANKKKVVKKQVNKRKVVRAKPAKKKVVVKNSSKKKVAVKRKASTKQVKKPAKSKKAAVTKRGGNRKAEGRGHGRKRG